MRIPNGIIVIITAAQIFSTTGQGATPTAPPAKPAPQASSQPQGPKPPAPKPAPAAIPIPPAPRPAPAPPIKFPTESPKPLPPPPAPLPKPPPAVRLTTTVKPPTNPKVMKLKGGELPQVYLGNLSDMRDLDTAIENTKGQYEAAVSAVRAYSDIYARQRSLVVSHAISREELEQSLLDRDAAIALEKYYAAAIKSNQARFEQKEFSANIAAGKLAYDLDTLYTLYTKEWAAQCEAAKAAIASAEAQLRLNAFVYETTSRLYTSRAASHYELQLRTKDYVAARADLSAKKNLDARCLKNLPTLQQLKDMIPHAESAAE